MSASSLLRYKTWLEQPRELNPLSLINAQPSTSSLIQAHTMRSAILLSLVLSVLSASTLAAPIAAPAPLFANNFHLNNAGKVKQADKTGQSHSYSGVGGPADGGSVNSANNSNDRGLLGLGSLLNIGTSTWSLLQESSLRVPDVLCTDNGGKAGYAASGDAGSGSTGSGGSGDSFSGAGGRATGGSVAGPADGLINVLASQYFF
jgi:hypothetical protein